MIAATLDAALKAVGLPIVGVAVGTPHPRIEDEPVRRRPATDKTSWRIDWGGEPTDTQKTAALAVIAALDPSNLPPPAKTRVEALEERVNALEAVRTVR